MRKLSCDALDVQNVCQELAQFEDPVTEFLEARVVRKKLVVMVPHHRNAASRRAHDIFVFLKYPDESFGQRTRLVEAARIRQGLPAARLGVWKIDLDTVSFENLDRGHSDLGIKLVDVARDE